MAVIKHGERYGAYMTSNNAPAPYAASASQNSWGAFRAFSESLDDDITFTGLAAGAEQWVQIKLDAPIRIWAFRICCRTTVSAKDSGQVPKNFTIQGSVDGAVFEDIQAYADAEWTQFTSWDASVNKYDWSDAKKIEVNCQKEYQYYRFVFGECQSISTQKSTGMTPTSSNTVKPTLIDLYQIEGTEETETYDVQFTDWDGTVLSEQTVERGAKAEAPVPPIREGYFFLGWDNDFSSVTCNLVVTAMYDPEATVTVSPTVLNLIENQSADIAATLLPETLTEKKIVWSGSVAEVAEYDPVSGKVKALSPGKAVITATHESQKIWAACEVTVLVDTIESIEISSLPNKTSYYVGETLNTSGLSIRASYASGKADTISDGYMVSGFDSSSVGKKTVTVEYKGMTTAFTVEIISSAAHIFDMGVTPGEITGTIDVESGTFTISGKGAIKDYSLEDALFQLNGMEEIVTSISKCSIGEGITRIGSYTFCSFGKVTEWSFPDSLVEMGDNAFEKCQIQYIFSSDRCFPSLTKIGAYFTRHENNLEIDTISVDINSIFPELKEIGDHAFTECCSWYFSSYSFTPFYMGNYAFPDTAEGELSGLDLSQVLYIGDHAFGSVHYGEYGYEAWDPTLTFTLSSCEHLGAGALNLYCDDKSIITIENDGIEIDDSDDVFSKNVTLRANKGSNTESYALRYGYKIFIMMDGWDYVFPLCDNIIGKIDTSTQTLVFSGNGEMPDFDISDNRFFMWDMQYWHDIYNITVEDGITKLGSYCFCDTSAEMIKIPDSVIVISENAFEMEYNDHVWHADQYPDSLEALGDYLPLKRTQTLPASLREIVPGIFEDLSYDFDTLFVPENGIIDSSMYSAAQFEKNVVAIPDGTVEIGAWAFNNACFGYRNSLEVIIPTSVNKIGTYAFATTYTSNKAYITDVTIYSRNCEIESNAFSKKYTTIHCYQRSTAEAYAIENGCKYELLEVPKYFVTFVDWDGNVLSEQEVERGFNAEAPKNPVHEGYFFLGWDKDFSVITEDMTITAMYDPVATVLLEPESIACIMGESSTIVVTLLPESLTQTELEWSVSDGRVVEVDPKAGTIKALKPGTATVTVTHVSQQVSASCAVTVDDTIQSLKISKLPDKVEYIVGEALDLTGLKVTATWASGVSEQITDYTVTGFDSSSVGEKTITIEYNGATDVFVIEVINNRVISIEITHQPVITVYLIGNKLDLTGMVVMATWLSGATTEVVDYRVSGYNPEQPGEQIVTVEFEDSSDTFIVLVKAVTSIKLTQNPDKTEYFVGESFDASGMQFVAHCTDGTDMDCTEDVGVEFHNEMILEAPAAFGIFREYTVEIPVSVDRAFVGEPTKEDVILTYDFATDSCIISGCGGCGAISTLLKNYKEKVIDIRIEGVSSIASGYLYGFSTMESAIILAPLDALPSATFQECIRLKEVILPDTLREIGSSCFGVCTSLEDIALPDGVELIGSAAFSRSGIREIVMPSDLKTLSTAVFEGCAELQNIILNEGLKEVGHNAFNGCKELRVLIFPDSVTEINSSIWNISTLDYVKYPAGMPVIAAPRGTNAKTVVIPEGVTEITSGSFSGFDRIEKVFLPNTLKTIENASFNKCSSLKYISIPESVENVRYGAFQDSGLEDIYFYGRNTMVDSSAAIPAGAVIHGYRGSSAEAYCEQFGNVFVPFDDYEFTDEIKTLYDTDSIRKRIVIRFTNGEAKDIENDRIYSESMSLTESICDEDNLTFGGCNASKFEIQVADVEEDIRGLEIEVKQYIEDKYVPIFTGKIDSADRQDNRRFKKIVAYDRMYAEGMQDITGWLKSLTFPMSVLELRDKVCEKLGFIQTSVSLINDYITIKKLSVQAGITGRGVLRAICELNGVFGYITRMGYFDYISLEKNEQPFSVTAYRKVKYEEYTVRGIESLSIRGSNGDTVLTLGNGNRYVLRDNFLIYGMSGNVLQEAAKNLLGKIRGIAYRNFSGDGRGLPYILPGRHVQYIVNSRSANRSTTVIDSYVMKRTLTGIQALKDTYWAAGEEFQPDIPANASTSETARQLEDYVSVDDLDMELDTKFEEYTQSEQCQINIEAVVQAALQNAGYFKIVSVSELPTNPAADTVYLIQGEVTVS